LTLSDIYSDTPQLPAFVTGDLSGQAAKPFVSGYQLGRENTQSHVFNVNLVAPLGQGYLIEREVVQLSLTQAFYITHRRCDL